MGAFLRLCSPLLCCLLSCCLGEEPGPGLTYNQVLLSSSCRARCIHTYVGVEDPSDVKCIANMDCYRCWGVCENALRDPSTCDEDNNVCTDGCQVACEFTRYHGDSSTLAYDLDLWTFPETPTRAAESDTLLKVTWPAAERHSGEGTAVVYTLMWTYDQMNDWSPVCTTTELWADVEGPHYQFPGLEFLVLAVTSDGLVAEAVPVDKSALLLQQSAPSTPRSPLSVHVRVGERSQLQAAVSWELPAGQRPGSYLVRWGREACECELPGGIQRDSLRVQAEHNQPTTFDLRGLTYNSRYWVEVELSHGLAARVYFYTPQCETPDSTCTRCHQSPHVFTALNTINTQTGVMMVEEVSTFTIVGFCVACAGAVLCLGVVLSYKHKQLVAAFSSQTEALRAKTASLRSRADTLRFSVTSRLTRQSFRSTSTPARANTNKLHDIEVGSSYDSLDLWSDLVPRSSRCPSSPSTSVTYPSLSITPTDGSPARTAGPLSPGHEESQQEALDSSCELSPLDPASCYQTVYVEVEAEDTEC